ncbi:MAG: hypothetical protein ACE10H_16270 [Candidatus Binatia bacterium]
MENQALDAYESGMHSARERFAKDPSLGTILAAEIDPAFLESFLIHFSALGVAMTEPVEDWIRRAGARCEEIGLNELGQALRKHASHEAGHHHLMVQDTRSLVSRWNSRRPFPLDADRIHAQPLTPGVRMYRQLHEDVILGGSPFCQLAIEYEIEMLSVQFGPRFIEQCVSVLAPEIASSLTFLREHVALDVRHTRFNRQELEKILTSHPKFVNPLVETGRAALHTYAAFLKDCLVIARMQVKGMG